MTAVDIHQLLDGKWEAGRRPKEIFAEHVSARPTAYVEPIVAGLSAKSRRVQNGCAELASLLSEPHPELLYPHLSLFVANLGSRAKALRWEAVCTLGNLAAVDERRQIGKLVPTLLLLLEDESIVLQGHAVRALAKIARANARRAGAILEALFAAAPSFPGNRVGYLVEAAEAFDGSPKLAARAVELVTPYRDSPVAAVARKAKRALRRLDRRPGGQ